MLALRQQVRVPLGGECQELIRRMAEGGPSWGYFRIQGELLKLGCTVTATAIRSVLRRSGIPPAGRRSRLTWKRFLAAHAQTLVAANSSPWTPSSGTPHGFRTRRLHVCRCDVTRIQLYAGLGVSGFIKGGG